MNIIFLILLKLEHLKLGYELAPSMPKGNGMTYDHAACKAAVEEFVLGLVIGDVFHYLDVVEHMSSYKGLSRKDKQKKYARSAASLMRSANYFMHLVKLVLEVITGNPNDIASKFEIDAGSFTEGRTKRSFCL